MKIQEFWKGILVALLAVACAGGIWLIVSPGKQPAEAQVSESVTATPTQITIEVDGKTFTFENAGGKSISELLADADITINEGDVVSFDLNQVLSGGDLVITILRKEDTPLVLDIAGQQIALEDVEGKTLSELLSESGLTISEGDILTFESDQALSGDLSVRILSRSNVTILVTDDESGDEIQYHIVMNGGTVEDALRAAGLTLGENQEINVDLSAPLQDGMEILIAEKEEESSEEEEEEEESYYSNYWESDDNSTTTTTTTTTESSTTTSQESSTTTSQESSTTTSQESSTTATESSTLAEESSEEITIVSVEVYEDCDGSGHGVKIITYSDGSQEEVPY